MANEKNIELHALKAGLQKYDNSLAKVAKTNSYPDLDDKPTFKTINSNSILGTGDIEIAGGTNDYNQLVNTPTFKTINGSSILGTGDIVIDSGSNNNETPIYSYDVSLGNAFRNRYGIYYPEFTPTKLHKNAPNATDLSAIPFGSIVILNMIPLMAESTETTFRAIALRKYSDTASNTDNGIMPVKNILICKKEHRFYSNSSPSDTDTSYIKDRLISYLYDDVISSQTFDLVPYDICDSRECDTLFITNAGSTEEGVPYYQLLDVDTLSSISKDVKFNSWLQTSKQYDLVWLADTISKADFQTLISTQQNPSSGIYYQNGLLKIRLARGTKSEIPTYIYLRILYPDTYFPQELLKGGHYHISFSYELTNGSPKTQITAIITY